MGSLSIQDEHFMALAIAEAEQAARQNEVPVGCVITLDQQVIARAHNRRELDQDPTAHAEILALRRASEAIGSWRLENANLYVTLEPCPMCAGALVLARVERLVFACRDPKAGAVRSLLDLCEDSRLNHRVEVVEGVRADECRGLLKTFFSEVRAGTRRKTPR